MIVEYLNSSGSWIEVDRQFGTGVAMTDYGCMLRGYHRDRYRDKLATVATLEYHYPIHPSERRIRDVVDLLMEILPKRLGVLVGRFGICHVVKSVRH